MYHVAAFRSKKLSGESFYSSKVNVSNIHSFSDFAVASNKISHKRVHTPRAASERSDGHQISNVDSFVDLENCPLSNWTLCIAEVASPLRVNQVLV